jgi:hypothetical protein
VTDREFNFIVRANLRAAADHIRRGHTGRWRDCHNALCRDAQHFVPVIEVVSSLPAALGPAALARPALQVPLELATAATN